MFFITPQSSERPTAAPTAPENVQDDSALRRKRKAVDEENRQDQGRVHSYYPKRISRACDRCRLKKTRCSGGKICERCQHDGVVCVTTLKPKSDEHGKSSGYVQLVESQRDRLLQALQKVIQDSAGTADQGRVRTFLHDMGLSIDNLQPLADTKFDPSVIDTGERSPAVWDDIFGSLNTSQLEAIESLCLPDFSIQARHLGDDELTPDDACFRSDGSPGFAQDGLQINDVNLQDSNDQALQWPWDSLFDQANAVSSSYVDQENQHP